MGTVEYDRALGKYFLTFSSAVKSVRKSSRQALKVRTGDRKWSSWSRAMFLLLCHLLSPLTLCLLAELRSAWRAPSRQTTRRRTPSPRCCSSTSRNPILPQLRSPVATPSPPPCSRNPATGWASLRWKGHVSLHRGLLIVSRDLLMFVCFSSSTGWMEHN